MTPKDLDRQIEKIIGYWEDGEGYKLKEYVEYPEKVKQLKSLFVEYALEIIGEDEKSGSIGGIPTQDMTDDIRNQLRSELRERLKGL